MQPADQGMRHNASDPLNWARDRRIDSQGAMNSRRVVIARIGFYESAQVLLTQCDDMSTHSRRIVPISRSTKPFCHGEPGATEVLDGSNVIAMTAKW
jgi:hypothetical protein